MNLWIIMACELISSLKVSNVLGECSLWDGNAQKIWWIDIESSLLYSYDWKTRKIEIYSMAERVGSFALVAQSSSLLVAFETGLALWDPVTEKVGWIEKLYPKGCGVRLNDGRVDPAGRFWVGAMVEIQDRTQHSSNLFSFSFGEGVLSHQKNIEISNSLCWSPDGGTQYFADSPKNTIYAYDYDKNEPKVENKRVFATTPKGIHPDGSCVDMEGFLWNAQWGAGKVVRYSPSGEVNFELEVPSQQPTCVAFGGPDLDHLIVTTARLGLNKGDASYNDSGNVFIYKTHYKGRSEMRFDPDI